MTDREKMFVYKTALETIVELSQDWDMSKYSLRQTAEVALKVCKERGDEEEYNA